MPHNHNSQQPIQLRYYNNSLLRLVITQFISCGFLNPTNYVESIRFLKVSVFNAREKWTDSDLHEFFLDTLQTSLSTSVKFFSPHLQWYRLQTRILLLKEIVQDNKKLKFLQPENVKICKANACFEMCQIYNTRRFLQEMVGFYALDLKNDAFSKILIQPPANKVPRPRKSERDAF